ncbi:MAG: competence/damage-inducible protein A [Bacteroidaceae bacterium]
MFVEIITIGDELLIGQVVDTNSAWMGKELNKAGFEVIRITSVRDREAEIIEAIDAAMKRAGIVLLTGGLGPTKDDITKKTLCKYFDTELIRNEMVLENVKRILERSHIAMIQSNLDQALVPQKATVINNSVGSAPITWFDREGKVLVSMPGVPQEMKTVMSEEIIPRLCKQFTLETIVHKTYSVKNYPESILADKLSDWEDNLPQCIKLAYLPQQAIIRLRLTGIGNDKQQIENAIQQEVIKLFEILGDAIFAEEDASVSKLIGDLLRKRQQTLATAESCTGGNIAANITAISGSSDYFKGSIVAYANEVKMNLLHVQKETLAKHGAVSEETVIEMSKGAMKSLNTDYAIATSGIAGPGGGTKEKPVGTVWIAIASKHKVVTKKLEFDRGREQNIIRATNNALLLLHEMLLEN